MPWIRPVGGRGRAPDGPQRSIGTNRRQGTDRSWRPHGSTDSARPRRSIVPVLTILGALWSVVGIGTAAASAPAAGAAPASSSSAVTLAYPTNVAMNTTTGASYVAGVDGVAFLGPDGTVEHTVALPTSGSAGVVLDGANLYVSRPDREVIVRIDVATHTVTATFPVPKVRSELVVVGGKVVYRFRPGAGVGQTQLGRLDPVDGALTDLGVARSVRSASSTT